MGNLDLLHPEYEFVDEDGDYYYMDLAYLRLPRPTNLEADSFGSHARDADRWDFRRGRRRQNSVGLDNWNILRFAIDDLKDDLAYCRRTLEKMLEKWYGEEAEDLGKLPLREREIVRLATRSVIPITARDVCISQGISSRLARDLLHQLVEKDILEYAGGSQRIHSYRLKQKVTRKLRP